MPAEIQKATGRNADREVPAPSSDVTVRELREPVRHDFERSMQAKIRYAHELAKSGLLPKAYQRQPENVLFALEYAEMLGISPVAAMMGIFVIDNKPGASAGLISGLIRRAGHRMWIDVADDKQSVTCTIIRHDDPKHPFISTWTMDRARQAKLTGKGNWLTYPEAMLTARAITEAGRMGCQDVLWGMAYTPEELGWEGTDETELEPGKITINGHAEPQPEPSGDDLAPPQAVRTLISTYRSMGMMDTTDIKDAIQVTIDRKLTDPPDLTIDECEFISAELIGIAATAAEMEVEQLSALHAYLDERRAVEADSE